MRTGVRDVFQRLIWHEQTTVSPRLIARIDIFLLDMLDVVTLNDKGTRLAHLEFRGLHASHRFRSAVDRDG